MQEEINKKIPKIEPYSIALPSLL